MSGARRVEGPRSLQAELPAMDEVRTRAADASAPAEELRLVAPSPAPLRRPRGLLASAPTDGAPPPSPHAVAALEASVGRLRTIDEAPALMAIDAPSRAALAGRLAAITEMARTVDDLLALGREARGLLRGGGPV